MKLDLLDEDDADAEVGVLELDEEDDPLAERVERASPETSHCTSAQTERS